MESVSCPLDNEHVRRYNDIGQVLFFCLLPVWLWSLLWTYCVRANPVFVNVSCYTNYTAMHCMWPVDQLVPLSGNPTLKGAETKPRIPEHGYMMTWNKPANMCYCLQRTNPYFCPLNMYPPPPPSIHFSPPPPPIHFSSPMPPPPLPS